MLALLYCCRAQAKAPSNNGSNAPAASKPTPNPNSNPNTNTPSTKLTTANTNINTNTNTNANTNANTNKTMANVKNATNTAVQLAALAQVNGNVHANGNINGNANANANVNANGHIEGNGINQLKIADKENLARAESDLSYSLEHVDLALYQSNTLRGQNGEPHRDTILSMEGGEGVMRSNTASRRAEGNPYATNPGLGDDFQVSTPKQSASITEKVKTGLKMLQKKNPIR
ncbi:hypothetical protein RFI_15156, partial [Reticulomyxa filosa]